MWSIGNEILEQGADDGWKVAVMLRDIVHRTDPDRPVTAGLSFGDDALDKGMAAVIDVPGFNYKPHRYQEYHDRLPGRPIYGSETASTVSSRGEYFFPVKEALACHPGLQSSSYDLEYPAWATTPDKEFHFQDKCKFVMGEFVWRPASIISVSRVPTISHGRRTRRISAYSTSAAYRKTELFFIRAAGPKENVLHLLPHWNWPNRIGEDDSCPLLHSFETVELFLNGKSLGKKSKNGESRLILDDVVYEPGELRAVAFDKREKPVMEAFRRTTSEPAAVKLMPENTKKKADGESLFFVRVGVYDNSCELHPTASNRINFSVEGPAEFAGIANGDPTCIETFDQKHIHAFNGQALVILRSIKGKPVK
jgi:beta-galactosidase